MLVDVIRLRCEGVKLPAEQVKACAPVRGHLSVMSRVARTRRQERVLLALLLDQASQMKDVLPPLDLVRLTALRGNQFVLQGVEELTRGVRHVETFAQSWWCQLVVPDAHAGNPLLQATTDEEDDELCWVSAR